MIIKERLHLNIAILESIAIIVSKLEIIWDFGNMEKANKDNTLDTVIGHNVRELRKQNNISQRKLADYLGVTFQQVQKYEAGQNRLPVESLYHLKTLFDIPYDYFFYGVEEQGLADLAGYEPDPHISSILSKLFVIDNRKLKSQIDQIVGVLMD